MGEGEAGSVNGTGPSRGGNAAALAPSSSLLLLLSMHNEFAAVKPRLHFPRTASARAGVARVPSRVVLTSFCGRF
jgi:hypothetical protein